MRRVFQKGLDCLHQLFSCKCPAQPIPMTLHTLEKPSGSLVVLCAYYTVHGREALCAKFSYVNAAIVRRVQLACGYCVPSAGSPKRGLLVKTTFLIHPEGQITDAVGRVVGFIDKF